MPGRNAFTISAPSAWPASAWLLLAVNLLPLAGAVFLNWQVLDLLLLFWLENLVIGGFNLVRMAAAPSSSGGFSRIFRMAFFTVHYGGFAFAHGMAVLTLFGTRGAGLSDSAQLLALIQTPAMLWAAAALVVSHAVSLILNDFRNGEIRRYPAESLMTRPYKRVVVLHLTILGGGLAASLLGSPGWALVVLVAVKMVIDLKLHLREHSSHLIMHHAVGDSRRISG